MSINSILYSDNESKMNQIGRQSNRKKCIESTQECKEEKRHKE